MAEPISVTVSIPTILRPHTGGQKRVSASGDTLSAVISDLEANYSGISDRLVDNGKLHRFVNIYVNDEDVRFSGGMDTTLSDGDSVTIRVPAGTPSGRTFRVRNRGVSTANGTGDLLATVEVIVPTELSEQERSAIEALRAASEALRAASASAGA